MKFFTDKSVKSIEWPYLLIKIPDYIKLQDKSCWDEILIDPGVWELLTNYKYSWEDSVLLHEFLDTLPKNHYFSLDYPSDMNIPFQKLFLDKSRLFAQGFAYHPQFIVTVQFYHNNYWSFIENFDWYNKLNIKSGILGLGNMCRHRSLNQFLKHSLDYAFSHCSHYRIHIYGLCKMAIPYAKRLSHHFKIELSIDSTKWQYYRDSKNRCEDFQEYIKEFL